jgi:hypothetical protein
VQVQSFCDRSDIWPEQNFTVLRRLADRNMGAKLPLVKALKEMIVFDQLEAQILLRILQIF